MDTTRILLGPCITEKSLSGVAKNRYTFAVAKEAAKPEIKNAIEKTFKVDVLNVHVVNTRGKKVHFGKRRQVGCTSPQRKAIVIIKPGQKIDLFEVSK